MEPEGSFPHSHVPATCPCQINPVSAPIPLSEDPSQYHPLIYAWLFPVVSFPQVSLPNILYLPLLSPICATSPAHFILLDLIPRIIFGEEYRSLSSSLCSFLHSPVT